ncbi:hypothetical protein DKT77_04360 [Meridianimarinicoccus roseus]|uniref:Uncharacterized protein n=1 Tax=Meridianimarinicoccus roseus TaxID=2072018 RepID=A0A2V2LNY0_9RHOB|nr:VPLPA-CTERM sorting domain-containing protein [Meridianimarinicoccus roseus]PWR03949.1 hypothetical protein DKT77_04360 [Meridianimarinicoccus roseus]
MRSALLAACVALCTGTAASAALVVNVTEDATGFFAEYAGSIDQNGLVGLYSASLQGGQLSAAKRVSNAGFLLSFGDNTSSSGQAYEFASGPSAVDIINVGITAPVSASGLGIPLFLGSDTFTAPYVVFDNATVSNAFFQGSNAWTGLYKPSIDLGTAFNLGSYVYTLANGETITLNIGNSFAQALPTSAEVPLPAGLPLLATGALVLVALRRRGGTV